MFFTMNAINITNSVKVNICLYWKLVKRHQFEIRNLVVVFLCLNVESDWLTACCNHILYCVHNFIIYYVCYCFVKRFAASQNICIYFELHCLYKIKLILTSVMCFVFTLKYWTYYWIIKSLELTITVLFEWKNHQEHYMVYLTVFLVTSYKSINSEIKFRFSYRDP